MATITTIVDCPTCPRITTLLVSKEGFMKWRQDHIFIQEALPELSATNRETLISGICRRCQDEVFDEDD